MAALGSVQQRGRRAPQYAGMVAGLLVGLLLGALVLAPLSTRSVAAKLAQAGELRGCTVWWRPAVDVAPCGPIEFPLCCCDIAAAHHASRPLGSLPAEEHSLSLQTELDKVRDAGSLCDQQPCCGQPCLPPSAETTAPPATPQPQLRAEKDAAAKQADEARSGQAAVSRLGGAV